MGLLDAPRRSSRRRLDRRVSTDANAAEVDRLREELRRSRTNVWLLVAACVVLAIAVVLVLLIR